MSESHDRSQRETNDDDSVFRPTASLDALKTRARMLKFTRAFFEGAGYWEVQTPLLSRDVIVDAHIDPFVVQTDHDEPRFLQTSPEFAMKRLLAGGADSIYQITSAFRRGEVGRLHNPEFTILEWYRNDVSYHEQMDFTERFVRAFFIDAVDSADRPQEPFQRLRYDDAFAEFTGSRVLELPTAALVELSNAHAIIAPESLAATDRDGWLNLLLAELIEPRLGFQQPVFLYDYPASQSALAQVRASNPPVAERFELYLNGIELCNGYQELTDPDELVERVAQQLQIRLEEGRPPLPESSRLIAAMKSGLPRCAGVALGFDRLLMLALSATSIADVMTFPDANA